MPECKHIAVAGIGTDVGKTVASAVLAEMLSLPYWKPVSCGSDDTQRVQTLLNRKSTLPEAYTLPYPLSPQESAAKANISLEPEKITLPQGADHIVIEMAGGLLVPLDETSLLLDLFLHWPCAWIVVVSTYLGHINHTLLTLEGLQNRGIYPFGLIVNGPQNPLSEKTICAQSGVPIVGRMDRSQPLSYQTIQGYGHTWKQNKIWNTLPKPLRKTNSTVGTPIRKRSQPSTHSQ